LEANIVWQNFFEETDDCEEQDNDDNFGLINEETPEELLEFVYAQRYLEPRNRIPKSRDWSENVLPNYDPVRFRQTLRVSRESFQKILESIRSYHAFQANPSAHQLPVEKQLQIALFRFGRFGNAASLQDVARTFGISEGTVVNATSRVIEAVLSLGDRYLCWYSAEDSAKMKRRIHQMSGFRDCLGFLDGTTIVLTEKPMKDGEFYYSRKSVYGLNCQIVADLDARIRFLFCGYPASVHDSRCIEESDFCKHPQDFLEGPEYVLADSAYTLSKTILTPFKKPASLERDNAAFNRALSSVRVKVEHCIGIWKNRFQSMKGMGHRIGGKKSAKRVVDWVKACAILHNMVLKDDEWDGRDVGEGVFGAATESIVEDVAAAAHREHIKKQVLRYNS
jgi:hypothetical protein